MPSNRAPSLSDLFPAGTRLKEARLASGLRMRWYERGQGPCAVLLHGFPELAVSWRAQLADLGDDYRVVAPDMRGYGGTDAPSRVRDYSLDRLCGDVTDLCDQLGIDKVHLVGHDWGGAIAWEVAHRVPERLHSLAVLNCPPISLMLRAARRLGQLRRSWYIFFFQLPWLPEWWLTKDPAKLVRAMFPGTAAIEAPFTDELLAAYEEQIRERGLPGINYYRAALRQPHVRHRPVHVPTRLIWGLQDPALGPWFAEPEAYRDIAPDFDRVLLPEAAHWVQQEAPERVNSALREHWGSVIDGEL